MDEKTAAKGPVGQQDDGEGQVQTQKGEVVSIAEPMFIWILLLGIGLIIKFIVGASVVPTGSYGSTLLNIANFLLFFPGYIILPLIIGAAIGVEIGRRAASMKSAMKSSAITGIYICMVYLITIVIIYEIISFLIPAAKPAMSFLVENWFIIPSLIVILVTILFSIITHSRKVAI
ncbi:MAG: hypothetical protein ACP5MK_03000 [Candidatus Micrarchaeia archaeon]